MLPTTRTPEQIVEALDDLRCSTRADSKGPEIAKPSAIHPPSDFGDVVGMDGIKWTNKERNRFFFHQFVDHGTTFHTAAIANSHATQDAIKGGSSLDQLGRTSGDFDCRFCAEIGTEAFHQFLQEHDIQTSHDCSRSTLAKFAG